MGVMELVYHSFRVFSDDYIDGALRATRGNLITFFELSLPDQSPFPSIVIGKTRVCATLKPQMPSCPYTAI
jgi:hypothetical protein